ncbi:MAG: alpha/beta hydrolase-fold protein [Bacteroidota bacterium]
MQANHNSLYTLLLIIILINSYGCSSDDNTFVNEVSLSLTSTITGIEYPINVFLPPGYNESNQEFPVLYALDGQFLHDSYAAIMEDTGTPAILVSIHQGPSGRRNIDYLYPGATTYFSFLKTELIPLIEESFKASPTNRTLVGVSNGGLMVEIALFIEHPKNQFFTNYVAVDAPFLAVDMFPILSLAAERLTLGDRLPGKLVLTSALNSGFIGPFDEDTTAFQEFVEGYNFQGLQIFRAAFNEDHVTVASPSFRYTLDLLFN